jgi:hypothetical protein
LNNRKNFLVPPVEEYNCENCGEKVMGGRYNNHCPKCLWSKHVDDKLPGDRASDCHGLMRPVGAEQKGGRWRAIHVCMKCGVKRVVDLSDGDSVEVLVGLVARS